MSDAEKIMSDVIQTTSDLFCLFQPLEKQSVILVCVYGCIALKLNVLCGLYVVCGIRSRTGVRRMPLERENFGQHIANSALAGVPKCHAAALQRKTFKKQRRQKSFGTLIAFV